MLNKPRSTLQKLIIPIYRVSVIPGLYMGVKHYRSNRYAAEPQAPISIIQIAGREGMLAISYPAL